MGAADHRPPLQRVMALSARSAPNLIALGMSLAAGALLGDVWVVIAGSWLYTLLIARHATSASFRRLVCEADAQLLRELPAESSLTDPALMLVVRALRKGYDEIGRVLKESPEPVRIHLRAAVSSLDDIRAQAAQLIREVDELSRYLLTGPAETTLNTIQKLKQEIASASDASAKQQYESALSVRQDQLAAVTHVATEHGRMLASLQFIVGAVESFPALVIRLRVLESRAQQDRVKEIYEEMARMKMELASSQHLLEGLAQSAS